MQQRGEQLDLPSVTPRSHLPSIAIAVSRPCQPAGLGQRAQPAADELIEGVRAQVLDQGAQPRLAGRDDRPPWRVRLPAQPGWHLLRQVSGLVPELTEVPRPGQHAHHGDRQHEDQAVAPPPPLARVRHRASTCSRPGTSSSVLVKALVRAWGTDIDGPLVPEGSGVTP